MTDPHDRAPRPYSTLRDGKIVWVTPEEHSATGPMKRSRLETDEEVLKRTSRDFRWAKGPALDAVIQRSGYPKRCWVDE